MPRRVLVMRAGVGRRSPHSRRQVAARLDTSVRRIARAERRGLSQLRSSARAGRCGGGADHDPTPAASASPSKGDREGDSTTLVSAGREAGDEASPGATGVMEEFRTSGPPAGRATILPPPGDATEPPLMLLVAAAFAAGFVAMWARERRRPSAPGRP
jgi:hypothetical protein